MAKALGKNYLKDKDWEKIAEVGLTLKNFIPMTIMRDGKVEAPPDLSPYAALDFTIGNSPQECKGYVTHKIDFQNLWYIYVDRGLNKNEVVTFKWSPYRKKFGRIFSPKNSRFIFSVFTKESYNLLLNPDSSLELKGEYTKAAAPLLILGEGL